MLDEARRRTPPRLAVNSRPSCGTPRPTVVRNTRLQTDTQGGVNGDVLDTGVVHAL